MTKQDILHKTKFDDFIELPLSTQALYLHLCVQANSNNELTNPRAIMRSIGAKLDDLQTLEREGYLEYPNPFHSKIRIF